MDDVHETVQGWWDADAATYDGATGHSMSDPVEAAAWRAALAALLPASPARVLDVGSGTGSLALAAADLGHDVTGIDLSEVMLAKAQDKARGRSMAVTFLHRHADDPPDGPFDAVIERHVVWTLLDPVTSMLAWRQRTVPGGRLILFEGSWGGEGAMAKARDLLVPGIERLLHVGSHHHAEYPPDVLARLPLAGASSPRPFLDAVRASGWSAPRLYRLRDVEWAIATRRPWPLGWLDRNPRYAIVASA